MTNIESIDGKSSLFSPRKCKSIPSGPFLELEHLSLLLLLASQLEVLASFDGNLILSLAVGALQPGRRSTNDAELEHVEGPETPAYSTYFTDWFPT